MKRSPALAIVAILLGGCGGGRFRIVAPDAGVPISASSTVFGPHGERLFLPDDLEVVDRVELEVRHWSVFWTMLSLSEEEHDLSRRLEQEVRAAGGEAIVNLDVSLHVNLLRDIIAWVPLLPTMVTATVTGDIVRRPSPGPP